MFRKPIKYLCTLILVLVAAPSVSAAEKGPLGLGVMFGEPTGLTGKYWTSHTNALAFGLAYSFGDYFEVLTDYLWHFPSALSSASKGEISTEFVLYLGIGGAFFADSNNSSSRSRHFFQDDFRSNSVALGLRIPLGLEILPRKMPFGVFLELAPGMGIIPRVFGFLQGDVGIRFYF